MNFGKKSTLDRTVDPFERARKLLSSRLSRVLPSDVRARQLREASVTAGLYYAARATEEGGKPFEPATPEEIRQVGQAHYEKALKAEAHAALADKAEQVHDTSLAKKPQS